MKEKLYGLIMKVLSNDSTRLKTLTTSTQLLHPKIKCGTNDPFETDIDFTSTGKKTMQNQR